MSVSTPDELVRFDHAGPFFPKVDLGAIFEARYLPGPYRVAPGDILQLEMPTVMRAALPESTNQAPRPHLCRVRDDGRITLPLVGDSDVTGKTLHEIEDLAVAAYYPKYTVQRPSIVATVSEFSTVKVAIVGAVDEPGVYALNREERSLVGALMKAGGIVKEGASAVRIYKHGRKTPGEPIVMPVKGLNVAFADVVLEGGETVEVMRLDPEFFSVAGLVNKPGTFEYPPGARFTLLHAIGFGGGLDVVSDAKYVHVFRQDSNGEIVSATFDISGDGLAHAAGVEIHRGDIVWVADTLRTQVRRAIASVFRGGIYIGYNLANQ
jgi:protein involved in polysaccharide export with SLBB domain